MWEGGSVEAMPSDSRELPGIGGALGRTAPLGEAIEERRVIL